MAENHGAWSERDEVFRRRYQEARLAGLTDRQAKTFSESSRDISQLRKCVAGKCAPRLIAKILL